MLQSENNTPQQSKFERKNLNKRRGSGEMLKQSKIWQRGKPKFDTSQSDGRVAILSAERARSRVSAAAKFMFAPILILTATLVMKSSYQKYRTKTSENKHKQIHPDWQPTAGDSSRGNGVRPRERVAQKCNHQIGGAASFKIQSSALL